MASSGTQFEAYASLHGLFLLDGVLRGSLLVELESDLEIVELDPGTQTLMYQTETIRRSGGRLYSDRLPALRLRFARPADQDGIDRQAVGINRTLQSVLDCMRLYKPGALYLGGIIHLAQSRDGPISVFPRSWPENPLVFYSLESRMEVDGLRGFWGAMRSTPVRSRRHITLAVHWYSLSAEASGIEDRMLFLMTSAEALFQAGEQKKSKAGHIAHQAAALGLRKIGDEDAESHLRRSYQFRNHILHRGHADDWRRQTLRILSESDLLQFVSVTSEYVRLAIVTVVRQAAVG